MRKYIIVFIAFMTLLSACSMFSKYEGYMKDAKNSMRAGNYKESIESLNNALIEEPNSKDALSLKSMAEEAQQKEDDITDKNDFVADTSPIYSKLESLTAEINEDASNLSVDEANYLLGELQPIHDELEKISSRWIFSEKYTNSFGFLAGAAEDLSLVLTAIIEDISEPLELNGDYSRSNLVTKTILSNDSGIRARLSIDDFRNKMESFRSTSL